MLCIPTGYENKVKPIWNGGLLPWPWRTISFGFVPMEEEYEYRMGSAN